MLLRKVFRDLKQNATQFVAIFIMTFFALLVSAGFDANDTGILLSASNYYIDYNFKDLEVQGDLFNNGQITVLSDMDEIVAVDGVYQAEGKISLDKERPLLVNYISSNDVSRFLYVSGEEYKPGAAGAWLEARFAEPMGLNVGDFITIDSERTIQRQEIKGLIYSPEMAYYVPNNSYSEPEYGTHGFVYMDISQKPGDPYIYSGLNIDLKEVNGQGYSLTAKEKSYMSGMRQKILDRLDNQELIVRTKTETEVYKWFITSINDNSALGIAFPLIFMIVALLGIVSTMTRLTSKQRIQIGTMKALGFSKKKITFHYLSYSVVIAGLGGISGAAVGRYTLGTFLYDTHMYYYEDPYASLQLSYKTLVMIGIAIILCAFATYSCTRKILAENAAVILKPEAPKMGGKSIFEGTVFWQIISFSTKWNIRDIERNKLRTLTSVFGIMVTSMLIFTAFGFGETVKKQVDWMYGTTTPAKYQIAFADDVGADTVYDYACKYKGQQAQKVYVTVWSKNADATKYVSIIDSGNLCRVQNEDLEFIDIPNEGALFTTKAADYLDVAVGDTVSFRVPNDTKLYTVTIKGLARQAEEQGVLMSRTAWEKMQGDFRPNIVYTNMTVPLNLHDKDSQVLSVNTAEQLRRSLEVSNQVSYAISGVISIIAVVMGLVVLYNLGILSYSEKIREIATMKVLGFQTKTIQIILMQQNLTISILGAILGIPFGLIVLYELADSLYAEDSDTIIQPGIMPYLAAVVGTLLVSYVVNLYVTSKIKDIDMVEALKGVE
ncbi:MAG: ABC transporter permease [Pseudobutyrivibrio sp.]|nr:ABC transporter permease [Pseudobutyrivibrio sp.]